MDDVQPWPKVVKTSDLFSKDGIENTKRDKGELRLLVHCEGCPPFLTVVAPDATVSMLMKQVQQQHKDLFEAVGDVPAVKIRWLEDSHRHALPLQSSVGTLLADREKIYAAIRMDPNRVGEEGTAMSRTVDETISHWRAVCEQTAVELCAAAASEERRSEVIDSGGLACLLCVALHIGTLVPGDLSLQAVHRGLRELLEGEDAARTIVEAGCESQVVALLQAPDPDLAALGAFLCACMAKDKRSHAAVVSWGGVLRLAKGMALSSNPSFRFDAATALRLLATNPLSHPHLLDPTVLRAMKECAGEEADAPCQAKVIGAVLAAAQSGTRDVADRFTAAGFEPILARAAKVQDEHVRRTAFSALAALRGTKVDPHSLMEMPPVDEDLAQRISLNTPAVNAHQAGRRTHFDGEWSNDGGGSSSKAWGSKLLGMVQAGTTESIQEATKELIDGLRQGRGEELLQGGGIRVLEAMYRTQQTAARTDAAVAMGLLSRGSERQRAQLVAAGGVHLTLSLLRTPEVSAQTECAEVLSLLSLHKQLHATLIDQGALEVLLSLVHSSTVKVRVCAAKALSHLSSQPLIRSRIIQDKGVAKLLGALRGSDPSDPFTAYLSIIARHT